MLKPLFLLVFAISGTVIHAQQKTIYHQLLSVNAEWKNQPDIDDALKFQASITLNEQQLIQLHLTETERLLQKRKPNNLSAQQLHNRRQNLNVLHQYLTAGLFPINKLHAGRQPYFIDDNNTYCAVGYLMKMSGADNIARDIHNTQNYNYLADIKQPGLMEWVANSGLSFDELALMQPQYIDDWPCAIMELHYNNTGTDVNEYIEIHKSSIGWAYSANLNSVLFYNEGGVLYKTLPVTQMQSIYTSPAYYYNFPANENFADKGRIELRHTDNSLIYEYIYTDTSITEKFYKINPLNPVVKHFSMGENENTPVNTSLTFCGAYFGNTWTLHSLPATIGTVNPCTILPVGLRDFNYVIGNNSVELKWITASESNNEYFEIQRSADCVNFITIGKINGAGTTTSAKAYTFADREPQYLNHYRLKQVDLDGKFSYSKILFVKFKQANPIDIRENPVKSVLHLQIGSNQNAIEAIIMYDFFGRTIKVLSAKTGNQNIDVGGLAAGKYIIRLTTTDGQVYNRQFVKQ